MQLDTCWQPSAGILHMLPPLKFWMKQRYNIYIAQRPAKELQGLLNCNAKFVSKSKRTYSASELQVVKLSKAWGHAPQNFLGFPPAPALIINQTT